MIIGPNTAAQPPAHHPGSRKAGKAASHPQTPGEESQPATSPPSDTAFNAAAARGSKSASAPASDPSDSAGAIQNNFAAPGIRIENATQAARLIEQVKQTLLAEPGVALAAQAGQMPQHVLRLLA